MSLILPRRANISVLYKNNHIHEVAIFIANRSANQVGSFSWVVTQSTKKEDLIASMIYYIDAYMGIYKEVMAQM